MKTLAQAEQDFVTRERLAYTLCYWTCETHPWLQWPHETCPGPGMPVGASLDRLKDLLKETTNG